MSWMAKWAGGFPVVAERAEGARIVDLDGHEYVDFSLGDTGAMAGHAPAATRGRRGRPRAARDDADAAHRGRARPWPASSAAASACRCGSSRSRPPTPTASRCGWPARSPGRGKVLVFSYCYHGTVDETFVVLEDGAPRSRPGNVGPAVDPTTTTRVAEWNDLAGVERELAAGDVACVLCEPALTNIGIVLPQPGFHADLRDLCTQAGTLLAIDETHTLSAGPGGCTREWGLEPDLVTIGKAIAGGVPAGRLRDDRGPRRARRRPEGGRLRRRRRDRRHAGGQRAVARRRAGHARARADRGGLRVMARTAACFERGVADAIAARDLPWHVVRLGARVEYRFAPRPHVTGGEAAAAGDPELEDALHLFALNRGVLITPFHNMALMSPATTRADVDRHTEVFEQALDVLVK